MALALVPAVSTLVSRQVKSPQGIPSSEDKPRIKPLVDALQQRGWTVCRDRTILAGKVWNQEIERALVASRCVLVAWSQASVQSEWVRAETEPRAPRNGEIPSVSPSFEGLAAQQGA